MSTLSATLSYLNASELLDDDFLFLSPDKSLHARGCYAAFNCPVESGATIDGDVQRRLRRLFTQAQRDGITNPLIVGAIPFDKRKPASLFVPQYSRWFARDALADNVLQETPLRIRQLHQIPAQDTFCQMVSAGVNATRSGVLDKVVLSRLLKIETDRPLNAMQLLLLLNRQNPGSYNFHVPLAQGALVGASPELLLHKQGNVVTTQPLAGSARRSDNPAENRRLRQSLTHSDKDRHEHRLVIDAIRQMLAPRSRTLLIPETPSLLATPVLWHLATRITAEVSDQRENALSIACLLHPTPALCGTPFQAARDLITNLEPFERGLFGGIVGWSDAQGNGEWVVTIRCGEVRGNSVTLFAGAGIVPDSQPLSEWNETGVKLSTMLRAFGMTNDQECVA
ncbi:isochorismate synthase|uniref:isochorismate synthase n=1 Tax=Brenneria salicis ATCC 15712 = DSM 30166 TaxID=714314 RepID=A0A366I2R1_9GAMM|nr:isochorismate synthase [Brenneria salicis]NMN92971.1 isochorismate synthase [Brenneria salicis ATCC 15712 = DSM 30166]RBP61944.1 isochorismate synthase [Brenneria salicis ATCC 15712 = DSM 30166]RLM31251.1 isochorismate synthase [Brenneria salicis ATCC 15712 = DSM 30166]